MLASLGNRFPSVFIRTSVFQLSRLHLSTELCDKEYSELVHGTLEVLSDRFIEMEDQKEIVGFDVEYTDGVLKLELGNGSYVLNKQPPNKQLWLSSPISGPKRYYWEVNDKKWVNTRDNHCLIALLNEEIENLTQIKLQLTPEGLHKEVVDRE